MVDCEDQNLWQLNHHRLYGLQISSGCFNLLRISERGWCIDCVQGAAPKRDLSTLNYVFSLSTRFYRHWLKLENFLNSIKTTWFTVKLKSILQPHWTTAAGFAALGWFTETTELWSKREPMIDHIGPYRILKNHQQRFSKSKHKHD